MRAIAWAAATIVLAVTFVVLARARATALRRTAFAAGALAIAILVMFGMVWPSLLTVAALVCFPCLLVFLAGVVRPSLAERGWVRAYGTASVVLSAAFVAYEAVWILSLPKS